MESQHILCFECLNRKKENSFPDIIESSLAWILIKISTKVFSERRYVICNAAETLLSSNNQHDQPMQGQWYPGTFWPTIFIGNYCNSCTETGPKVILILFIRGFEIKLGFLLSFFLDPESISYSSWLGTLKRGSFGWNHTV